MTKREVLKNLERLKISSMACGMQSDNPTYEKAIEALDIAITALRGPTRERVEALPKCDYCEEEWGTCDPTTNRFTMPPRGGIRFCPMCGRHITDEAVDIMLKRLEVMKDENRTD